MLTAKYIKHVLNFKLPSGTSRGVLTNKESWYLIVSDTDAPNIKGIGECSLIPGLSPDDYDSYETKLNYVCDNITKETALLSELTEYPSIQFGLETALLDLKAEGTKKLFKSQFLNMDIPITINGLIWMGDKDFMIKQIKTKLNDGFNCLKLKIGAINFEDEVNILRNIRSEFNPEELELRVDANGAFSTSEVSKKLNVLSEFDIHSIEQPIKQKQYKEMAELCADSPIPIALDEELIGINNLEDKIWLLEKIEPHYIILKPSLIGGFKGTNEWIEIAGEMSIPWWITSALESNIGLNAITQFAATFNNPLPQGLGTGQLYTNNIDCPLTLKNDKLHYDHNKIWDLSLFA